VAVELEVPVISILEASFLRLVVSDERGRSGCLQFANPWSHSHREQVLMRVNEEQHMRVDTDGCGAVEAYYTEESLVDSLVATGRCSAGVARKPVTLT